MIIMLHEIRMLTFNSLTDSHEGKSGVISAPEYSFNSLTDSHAKKAR